jgi:hypothetical protein
MPNWLGPLLALVLLVGFLGFAFRQGTKTKPNDDDSEPRRRNSSRLGRPFLGSHQIRPLPFQTRPLRSQTGRDE